jgi:hypothetical protein
MSTSSYLLNELLRTCIDRGMFFVATPGESEESS